MQSNIQQAYLIRDEKNAGANTATRVGTLFAALCADVAQHEEDINNVSRRLSKVEQATTVKAYPSLALWSGETVEDVDVTMMSVVEQGDVVWDTAKRTFLLRVTGASGRQAYYNNWLPQGDGQAGRTDLQLGTWGVNDDEGQFRTGLLEDTIYKGKDGSAWIATGEDELTRVMPPAWPSVVDWTGEDVSVPMVWQQSTLTDEAGDEVVWCGELSTFLMRRDAPESDPPMKTYFNQWPSITKYQDNIRGASAGDGFVPGLRQNTIYRGKDGSVWAATSGDVLERLVEPVVIPEAESDLYLVGSLYALSDGEYASLDDIVGKPAQLIAAINAGKVVVVQGTTFKQLMPASTSLTGDAASGTVGIDWVTGNMQFSYSLTCKDGAWTGLTDGSKEIVRKDELPDTGPLEFAASLATNWQMSALPSKAEVVAAFKAGRQIRVAGVPSMVLVGYTDSNPGMLSLVVVKWTGALVVGTVTYSGTATEWGYDAGMYKEMEMQAVQLG